MIFSVQWTMDIADRTGFYETLKPEWDKAGLKTVLDTDVTDTAFHTDWKTAAVDVSAYSGEVITHR